MRIFRILFLGICLILSVFNISEAQTSKKKKSTSKKSSELKKFDKTGCNLTSGSYIGGKRVTTHYNCPPIIKSINFSQTEIIKKEDALIQVAVDAQDPDGDTLLYKYQVSTGKIIGEGAKVYWDLSTAEVGIHSITIEIDDGCDCIKPVTKTVKVIECVNCQLPPGFGFSDEIRTGGFPIGSHTRRNRIEMSENKVPVIKTFNLSKTELTAKCSTESSNSENALTIDISVDAEDADNDTLLYKYAVTAGKIVGDGSNVVWDLSGVKPGKYQVAFEVDDGCGCVKPVTREITIVENSDCTKEN